MPPSSTPARNTLPSTASTLSSSSTPGLEHVAIDRKHVVAFLDHVPEHATVDLKHATTIVDLKPAVVDLTTVL
jgi:hypothetical protein